MKAQAFADSFRIVYIIAAPFGAVAAVAALWLGSVNMTMNYRVDAPVEKLTSPPRVCRRQGMIALIQDVEIEVMDLNFVITTSNLTFIDKFLGDVISEPWNREGSCYLR